MSRSIQRPTVRIQHVLSQTQVTPLLQILMGLLFVASCQLSFFICDKLLIESVDDVASQAEHFFRRKPELDVVVGRARHLELVYTAIAKVWCVGESVS